MQKTFFMAAAMLLTAVSLAAGQLKLECSVNKKDAIFKAGEKIVFQAKLLEDGKAPGSDRKIYYRLVHDHKVIKSGTVAGTETLSFETASAKPAWVFLDLRVKDQNDQFVRQEVKKDGKPAPLVTGGIGAMVDPEKILPPMQEPADFDAFWDKVKKELAAVPMKVLEKVQVPDDRANVYDVKIACAGEKPVSGYLCIPKDAKPRSCPAYVSFHGAGVRSSGKPVWMAAKGLIALDINAHGIENGKPADFYTDLYKNHYYARQGKTNIRHYAHWGKSDRDQFYFKGMYMRVMRALEYVKSLPEWDGKYLIVAGGSQGGAQVLAACALDKDITFARANVPAMCDHSGCLGDRRSGWPALYKAGEVKTKPEFARCASYYDGAYFAKRIKCPIYINTGFMDTTCPPTSVFAAYNSIPAGVEKAMQTDPQGGHSTPHTDGLKALNRYIDSIMKK